MLNTRVGPAQHAGRSMGATANYVVHGSPLLHELALEKGHYGDVFIVSQTQTPARRISVSRKGIGYLASCTKGNNAQLGLHQAEIAIAVF